MTDCYQIVQIQTQWMEIYIRLIQKELHTSEYHNNLLLHLTNNEFVQSPKKYENSSKLTKQSSKNEKKILPQAKVAQLIGLHAAV